MYAGFGIILSSLLLGLLLRTFEARRGKPGGYVFQVFAGLGSAVIYYIWILTFRETSPFSFSGRRLCPSPWAPF